MVFKDAKISSIGTYVLVPDISLQGDSVEPCMGICVWPVCWSLAVKGKFEKDHSPYYRPCAQSENIIILVKIKSRRKAEYSRVE